MKYRVKERVVLCGDVDDRIENYSNHCQEAKKELGQDLTVALEQFIEEIGDTVEQAETGSWLVNYFPEVKIVQERAIDHYRSQLKLTAGSVTGLDNLGLKDLIQYASEIKDSIKKSLPLLSGKENKIVQGLEDLAIYALKDGDQKLPDFAAIDIFERVKNQRRIWDVLHSSSSEVLLRKLAGIDLSENYYPTATQWEYLSDALFTYAWQSRDYLNLNSVYQTLLENLKEFFHVQSLYLAKLNLYHITDLKEGSYRRTEAYFIEKVPILQLTTTGHYNRIKPSTNKQFKNTNTIESLTVSIEGINEGIVELSTLNAFVQSTFNTDDTMTGMPSHFMCRANEECLLLKGSNLISPFTEWKIKLLGDQHGTNTAHNIIVKFSLTSEDEIDKEDEWLSLPVMDKQPMAGNGPTWCPVDTPDRSYQNRTENSLTINNYEAQEETPKPFSSNYDDDFNFVRGKYGYHSTILGLTDMLIATDLDQMNNLFENLHSTGEGVVTNFTTPMFMYAEEECRILFGFWNARYERYIGLTGSLLPPKFYFLKNNEQTVRITWEFDESSQFDYRNDIIPCDEWSPVNTSYAEHGDSIKAATMEAYIPLKILFGTIEEENGSGGVILELRTSAFQPEHLTFSCEECKEVLFHAIKDIFIEKMTEIYLTTINYDPAITPVEVRPTKFRFSTVCKNCDNIDGSGGGYGYLIVLVCANTFCAEDLSSFDPFELGLDEATPAWHSTIIFLASHVLFRVNILCKLLDCWPYSGLS